LIAFAGRPSPITHRQRREGADDGHQEQRLNSGFDHVER
jgi:hypothetical protein